MIKKKPRLKREAKTGMKTMQEKVQTLRQVLTELKIEAEQTIKDYERSNTFRVNVSGKIEGYKTAIALIDLIDHLKTKDEQSYEDTAQ